MLKAVGDFVHELGFADLPPEVVEQARRCLLDLVGVAITGHGTELSRIVRDFAAHNMAGDRRPASLWLDGRVVSPAGAALANAATIDAMDAHDGHRLSKGHAGAALLPATIATAEGSGTTIREVLTPLVVGYEVATRAGIALHASAEDYHSSGAWNSIGAAAVAARSLGLDRAASEHALGIAEYHGPRAPMMRGIGHPTMVKDSSGWGAHTGVSAALLAAEGFTGAPAQLIDSPSADSLWHDLGDRWLIMEQYFKRHPVCRWAHPAVDAMIELRREHHVEPEAIRVIEVDTFAPATTLLRGIPVTTEEAQYSLAFPVAAAAVHGAVLPSLVHRPDLADDRLRRLADGMLVRESPTMTAAFPALREADVTLVLADGRRISSGPTTACGDPEQPLSTSTLIEKFRAGARPVLGDDRAERLLAVLTAEQDLELAELTDQLCPPIG